MRTVKRIVSILLALTMVFANLSAGAFAAETDSVEYGQIILSAEEGYVGINAISSLDNWQDRMFNLMGFAATVGGGSGKYFSAEEAAAPGTVYWFLNMSKELQEYVDEDGYVSVSYEIYQNIAEAYYLNVPDMKSYLIELGQMDEETEQIYYYLGGLGDAWSWVLCDVEAVSDGYKLKGIFCSGPVEDTTGLTECVDYYNGLYLNSAIELSVVKSEEHGWLIAAYTEIDYFKMEDYGSMGEVLYVYNEEKENFSDIYYLIDIAQPVADVSVFLKEDTYKVIDGMYCYSEDMTVEFEAECGEGWTCQVVVERTVNGEPVINTWADSGIFYGGGSVCITPVPLALYTIETEHAEVEILQGLVDMGDGTYAYDQTAAVEFRITPEEGYEISKVAAVNADSTVSGQYVSASGTWVIHPKFCPGIIRVAAKTDEVITIVSGEGSVENVTVQVSKADAAQVENLTLTVEALEEETEEKSASLVLENVDAEEVHILDIYFENTDGEEVKVQAEMIVTVPVPEGWDAACIAVYYVNSETGEVTNMNAMVSEDGKTVSFATNHFSHYALVQTEPVTEIFADVYKDWYVNYVQYVYDNALMTGIKGTDRFEPNANITKAQVAQVLYNMEGQPVTSDQSVFTELSDVYAGEWYANAVAWAFHTGVVTGDLNTKQFSPNANVTREQLALMMYRYAQYKDYDTLVSGDLTGLANAENVSNWAASGVKWAVGEGLISGIDTGSVKDLAPQGNASRAQMAAILQRFYANH